MKSAIQILIINHYSVLSSIEQNYFVRTSFMLTLTKKALVKHLKLISVTFFNRFKPLHRFQTMTFFNRFKPVKIYFIFFPTIWIFLAIRLTSQKFLLINDKLKKNWNLSYFLKFSPTTLGARRGLVFLKCTRFLTLDY